MIEKPGRARCAVLARDQNMVDFVVRALRGADLEASGAVIGSRGWTAPQQGGKSRGRISPVLLVPSPTQGAEQLELVRDLSATGRTAFLWTTESIARNLQEKRVWYLQQLLIQAGALADQRLSVLVEACRIASNVELSRGADIPVVQLKSTAASRALSTRLEQELARAGVRLSKQRSQRKRQKAPVLEIDATGHLLYLGKKGGRLSLGDPADVARALALLGLGKTKPKPLAIAEFTPKLEQALGIARPPPRLLSETTAKRLLACFGLEPGEEQLCRSTTEAVRHAARIDAPVVLKLVRPELQDKESLGAVVQRVQGASAVRRAVEQLKRVAFTLGPPEPLGFLVARQIEGGERLWVQAIRDQALGQILLIGQGDRPEDRPRAALSVPATAEAVRRVLEQSGLASPGAASDSLAVALFRLLEMLEHLGQRIVSAEIHPLVATDNSARAAALDAYIEISAKS